MGDLTVVYYTANRERPYFEKRIQERLVRNCAGTPIISVSQKPIELGVNICVGEVGASAQNAWRQLQLGVQAATTKFVCPAEADFIYPREYFQFRPMREDLFYIASPLWVAFAQRGYGHHFSLKPRGSEAAMVVGRQALLDRLEVILAGHSQWGTADAGYPGEAGKVTFLYSSRTTPRGEWTLRTPVVTFKTDQNIHKKTPHDVESKCKDLPGIGNVYDLLREFTGA